MLRCRRPKEIVVGAKPKEIVGGAKRLHWCRPKKLYRDRTERLLWSGAGVGRQIASVQAGKIVRRDCVDVGRKIALIQARKIVLV